MGKLLTTDVPLLAEGRMHTDTLVHLLMEVARADGVVHPEEMDALVGFLRRRLAWDADRLDRVRTLVSQSEPPATLDDDLRQMSPVARQLLLRAAFEIAHVDLEYHPAEREAIHALARRLEVPRCVLEALQAEFETWDRPSLLRILELDESASLDDARIHLGKLRERFNPRALALLGEEFVRLGADRLGQAEVAFQRLEALPGLWPKEPATPPSDFRDLRLAEMRLETRTGNCLLRAGKTCLSELLGTTRAEYFRIKGFGVGCWADLCRRLLAVVPYGHPWRARAEAMASWQEGDEVRDEASRAPFVSALPQEPEPEEPWLDPMDETPDTPETLLHRIAELVPERAWDILRERVAGRTLQEIGDHLGLTRERVRQLEQRAARPLAKSDLVQDLAGRIRELAEPGLGFLDLEELADLLGWSETPEAAKDVLILVAWLIDDFAWKPGTKWFIVDQEHVCRLKQLRSEAAALPRPVDLDSLAVFLYARTRHELERDQVLRIAREVWECPLLEDRDGRPFLVSVTPNFPHADGLAALLQVAGEPLPQEELHRQYLAAFPSRETTMQSLGNVMSADDRFFLVDTGTWALAEKMPDPGPRGEIWKDLVLKRLWSVGQVTNTRLLLDHLQQHEELPDWLNQHSLYWLLRRDPRFKTHRRLEVSPADADWERIDLRDQIEDLLAASNEPLHDSEISRRLAERRPMPDISIAQCLARGEEDGTFFRIGVGTWTIPEKLELPATLTERLQSLARRRIVGTREGLYCSDPSWRPGLEHLPTDRVDLALSRDATLFRSAAGVYVDARRAADWGRVPEVLVQILREEGEPLPTSALRDRLARSGRPVADQTLYQAVDRSADLVRYPYGYRSLVGLTSWGLEGYRKAVAMNWASARRAVLGNPVPPFEGPALEAVFSEARRLGDSEVLEVARDR